MEEGELSDDGLEYILSDDDQEEDKVEQVAKRILALEQKNKEIELIEIMVNSNFDNYLDYDGKENSFQSNRRHENGKVHESPKSKPSKRTSSTRRMPDREKTKKRKSLQIQKPKQFSRREKTYKKSKKNRSKSPHTCRTAIYEADSVDSTDEEILELRLMALSSKAEVKEIAIKEGIERIPTVNSSKPSKTIQTEEDELRLIALKSAFLKKCAARKKKKLLERPYSPSDEVVDEVLTVDIIDSNMEISPSLSPYLPDMEISNDDDEVCEMDLCQSSPEKFEEISEDRPVTPVFDPVMVKTKKGGMETDEEDEVCALRSLLLAQVKPPAEKREELPDIEKNLKLAVLRLKKMKNNQIQSEGDKTSSESFDAKKSIPNIPTNLAFTPPLPATSPLVKYIPDPPISTEKPALQKTVTNILPTIKKQQLPCPNLTQLSMVEESVLLKSIAERITSDPNLATSKAPKLKITPSPPISINESSKTAPAIASTLRANRNTLTVLPVKSKYRIVIPPKVSALKTHHSEGALISSSMTDTKNIPLISKKKLQRQSKLITSLDDCRKIVNRLVINLDEDTDDSADDPAENGMISREKTDIQPVSKNFQSSLDVFLKNIRKTGSAASIPPVVSNKVPIASTDIKATTSAVKHLPIAAQAEYEYLINKMNKLEKENRQKLLKRKQNVPSKTPIAIPNNVPSVPPLAVPVSNINSTTTPLLSTSTAPILQKRKSITSATVVNAKRLKESSPTKLKVPVTKDSLDKCLDKIFTLAPEGQNRIMEKSEMNYRNHSEKLLASTIKCVNLLKFNEAALIRREKLISSISQMEESLKEYKAQLHDVDKKVKSAVPRIIYSQKEIHSVKAQQLKFGNICEQVGRTIRGNEYKVPSSGCGPAINKYLKIAVDKTSKLVSDQNFLLHNKNLKMMLEKTTKLITDDVLATQLSSTAVDVQLVLDVKILENGDAIGDIAEKKEFEKDEILDTAENEIEKDEIGAIAKNEEVFEDFEVSAAVLKKIHYESPLSFRIDCTIDPTQICCPYAWNGVCQDNECSYLHT